MGVGVRGNSSSSRDLIGVRGGREGASLKIGDIQFCRCQMRHHSFASWYNSSKLAVTQPHVKDLFAVPVTRNLVGRGLKKKKLNEARRQTLEP